ncbi:MAG: DNA topology modulation protein [Oscillospiraceae bacterium]|nr:DNA topology modulation protein [Oscillospiraceae bacterium]
MKIAVLGYAACGKSTLAKFLAQKYGAPILYLDAVQFQANWQERSREEAVHMAASFLERESWVIDGNYRAFLQEERLRQADQIILMLFPRFTCLFRALRRYRTFRNKTRESMADGCMEKMDWGFVWWILHRGRTGGARAHYRDILRAYGEKTTVLRSQKQLDQFYDTLSKEPDTA